MNAVAPGARTRLTENLISPDDAADLQPAEFDAMAPENVAPLVAWLGSSLAAGVSGRVFNVAGGRISVAEGWNAGPEIDKGDRWDPGELAEPIRKLLAASAVTTSLLG